MRRGDPKVRIRPRGVDDVDHRIASCVLPAEGRIENAGSVRAWLPPGRRLEGRSARDEKAVPESGRQRRAACGMGDGEVTAGSCLRRRDSVQAAWQVGPIDRSLSDVLSLKADTASRWMATVGTQVTSVEVVERAARGVVGRTGYCPREGGRDGSEGDGQQAVIGWVRDFGCERRREAHEGRIDRRKQSKGRWCKS